MKLLDTMQEYNAFKQERTPESMRVADPKSAAKMSESMDALESLLDGLDVSVMEVGAGALRVTASWLVNLEDTGMLTPATDMELLEMVIPTTWIDGLIVGLRHARKT